MDKCSDQIFEFEQTLKNNSSRKCTLYSTDIKLLSNNYKIEDVILSVSKQITAIESADSINKQRQQCINKVKSSRMGLISNGILKENITNKFETQCVSDTQLVDIVQIVEAQEAETGITDKFDTTYCQKLKNIGNSESVTSEKAHIKTQSLHLSNTVDIQIKPYDNDVSCTSNAIFQDGDLLKTSYVDYKNKIEVHKEFSHSDDFEQFEALGDFQKSPVLSQMKPIIVKTNQSLICKLECFEKFEALALPIIEEYPDLQVAKRVINSQIGNKELFVEKNVEPFLRNKSPILISKMNSKKHIDSSMAICTSTHHKSQLSIIEDEILFSSDEESNHSSNGGEDLPLTCALHTSFYDYTGVLDKTMYVGFQTASNKTIQVNSDSFLKAQNLLSEDALENIELNDLVNMFDNSSKTINNSISIKPSKENFNSSSIYLKTDEHSYYGNGVVGFKMANGKATDISESALIKGTELLKHIDKGTQNSSADKHKTQYKLNSCTDTKKEEHNKETLTTVECIPHIEITKKDDKNINDIEDTWIKINDDIIIQEFETNLVEKGEKNNNVLPKPMVYNEMVFTDNALGCSKTIQISNTPVEFTKRVFEHVGELENICNATPINKLPGFKTASKKSIEVSEKSLLKYKNIFNDIDLTNNFENLIGNNDSEKCDMPMSMGFSTASNKKIIVTQKALLRSKRIFENIDTEPDLISSKDNLNKINSQEFEVFKTENNEVIEESKEALSKSNKISEDNIENVGNTSNKVYKPGIELQSFRTASNKPITVSSQLMNKYKNILEEIDICESNIEDIQNKNKSNKDINELTNKHESEEAIAQSKELCNISKEGSLLNNECHTFQGFQTASHKKINVPKEKLSNYLKIFDGIDLNIHGDENLLNNSNIESKVQNAHNIIVNENVNKQVSKQRKNLIQPSQSKILLQERSIFQTASSKPVSFTQEAFEASQKVINGTNMEADKDVINHSESAFVGFNTAGKRKIAINKETLAKAKKFFDDIDRIPSSEIKDLGEHLPSKFQFQTANNEIVEVSDEAIIASQKQFKVYTKGFRTSNNYISKEAGTMKTFDATNFNDECYVNNSENNFILLGNKDITTEHHSQQQIDLNCLNNMLDTQIINNFEDTLHTEDFLKETSPSSKRSGSPILPCPKAKKCKFVAPASVKNPIKHICYGNSIKGTFIFNSNYKKNKLYRLQDLNIFEERCKSKIETLFFDFNFDNILEFEFGTERNDLTGVKLSTTNIKEIFAESVNKEIIPNGWIENHLKLIMWKLISYEIKYPNTCYNMCSVRNVIEQLKYRYDRELYNVQRPAFRKILERDDIPNKTMVVCVVGFYRKGNYVSRVANSTDTIELLLTDGWYCIKASIDKLLAKYVFQGKISMGTKLVTHGAELINCDQGISPWQDTSSVRIKLFGNSTRRARWDARLGYHSNPSILTQLSAVKADGGKVSKLRVFVTRVYPTLYVEKFEDGSTVTRSERLENLHQMKYESDRQLLLEKIYEDVEKEFYEQESQDSEGIDTDSKLETGSQIARAIKNHRDPVEFRASLTESQLRNFHNHTIRHKEKQMDLIQQKVRDKIKNSKLSVARNVVPLMKIRVASVGDDLKISKGMVSIWRPNEELQEIVTEGKWIHIYNIVPTAVRNSEIQLSASRQSIFQKCEVKDSKKNTIIESLKRRCYSIQDISKNSHFNTDYNEIDTVGFLFSIEPSSSDFETSKQLFQNAFLADANKNIICVNFWGGIKKFGFEHILDTGQIIACVNLQKRSGNTVKSIPQYRATEFSYFTKTPKYECIREASKELIKMFSGLDKRKFQEECVAFRNNFAHMKNGNDVSPYRMNNSDYNISKNKMFIDSPIVKESNFNLSGLDFESTFKQSDTQDMAPHEILRKKKVNDKIVKLKMYGEPPPLSPISLINSSKKAVHAFRSPLTARNNVHVTNAENSTNTNKENSMEISPVMPLRKSGKRPSVNPVKLNFNYVENVDDMTTDPFEEDFDASPPLSLD